MKLCDIIGLLIHQAVQMHRTFLSKAFPLGWMLRQFLLGSNLLKCVYKGCYCSSVKSLFISFALSTHTAQSLWLCVVRFIAQIFYMHKRIYIQSNKIMDMAYFSFHARVGTRIASLLLIDWLCSFNSSSLPNPNSAAPDLSIGGWQCGEGVVVRTAVRQSEILWLSPCL